MLETRPPPLPFESRIPLTPSYRGGALGFIVEPEVLQHGPTTSFQTTTHMGLTDLDCRFTLRKSRVASALIWLQAEWRIDIMGMSRATHVDKMGGTVLAENTGPADLSVELRSSLLTLRRYRTRFDSSCWW